MPYDVVLLHARLVAERIGHTDKYRLARHQLATQNIVLLDYVAIGVLVDGRILLAEADIVVLRCELLVENRILHCEELAIVGLCDAHCEQRYEE